jgi:protein gp37
MICYQYVIRTGSRAKDAQGGHCGEANVIHETAPITFLADVFHTLHRSIRHKYIPQELTLREREGGTVVTRFTTWMKSVEKEDE